MTTAGKHMDTIKEKLFGLLSFQKLRGHNLLPRFPILRPFYRIYRGLYRGLKPEFVMIYGKKVYIGDDLIELARQKEQYESETTEVFKKMIKPGDTVIDIGANIGYYTVLASTLVGPTGKILAFEPSKQYFVLLEKTLKENNIKNVQAFQKAVGRKKSRGKMISDVLVSGDDVDVVSLDEFIHEPIQFIKMDIEGHEMEALNGMLKTIRKNPNLVLITEFNEYTLRAAGVSPDKFIALIKALGFTTTILGDKNKPYVKNLLCVIQH